MEIQKTLQSKAIKYTIVTIGALIIALFIFKAGMFFGYNKALFYGRFADNYSRNFDFRERGGPKGFMMDDFTGGQGAVGKIISVNLPNFVVESSDGIEKAVVITASTTIRKFRDTAGKDEIKMDNNVVIFGSPNDKGQIEAKLIRIIPTKNN